MNTDFEFKNLRLRVDTSSSVTRGTQVAKGYKPDITVSSADGQLTFILECETKTDRKAFLGDLVKAEKHSEESKARPILVLVMKPSPNTTVEQIASHLTPYASWLAGLKGGMLSLADVLVVSYDDYVASVQADEPLGSAEFRARCRSCLQRAVG